MPAPQFTVVIPAFNAEATIAATISSVLAQTVDSYELIVVDDGSSDGTVEVIGSFGDERLRLVRQENQGTAGARNTGIEAAAGTYVSFLDNDDLWMPGYLEAMRTVLDAAPGAGFAYADGWLLDSASGRVHRRSALQIAGRPESPPADPGEFLRSLVSQTFIRSATTMRRSALEQVGGFDPALSGVDDLDLWVRILAAGFEAVEAPGMLLVFRDRPDSLSKDGLRMCRGRRQVLEKIIASGEISEQTKQVARGQLPALDRLIAALERTSGPDQARLRARLLAGKVRRAATAPWRFHRQTPPEIVRAFGEPGPV